MKELKTKDQKKFEEAVLILNRQLNFAMVTFTANINKLLAAKGIKKQLSHSSLFQEFTLSIDDLVDVALSITPGCVSLSRNTRKAPHALTRQVLSYIAAEMGYSDNVIAAAIGSDRSTVHIARNKVSKALAYNDVTYVTIYEKFLKSFKKYPNGDIITDNYNI